MSVSSVSNKVSALAQGLSSTSSSPDSSAGTAASGSKAYVLTVRA